jgi:hypothetical protein
MIKAMDAMVGAQIVAVVKPRVMAALSSRLSRLNTLARPTS